MTTTVCFWSRISPPQKLWLFNCLDLLHGNSFFLSLTSGFLQVDHGHLPTSYDLAGLRTSKAARRGPPSFPTRSSPAPSRIYLGGCTPNSSSFSSCFPTCFPNSSHLGGNFEGMMVIDCRNMYTARAFPSILAGYIQILKGFNQVITRLIRGLPP